MEGRYLCAAGLLLSSMMAMAVQGKEVEYDWVVDYAFWSPDCVEKLIIAVNGEFPGPTINVTAGDTVVVKVTNKMPTEGVVIHWHGMHMRGTPWADGAAYVSQCPINPDEEFTYRFLAEYSGTYLWHGHYGMQRAAGFYGSMIVHPKPEDVALVPFKYDEELSIVLNDWWHRSMYDQELGLFSDLFRWVGEPQSLLIEGRGAYDCSLVPRGAVANSSDAVPCNTSSPQCSPYVLSVLPGKTYRLRIGSVASLNAFNFIVEGHNFTVVEADGRYVQPVNMSDIDVYSGETYSVIFTTDQNSSRNYWIGVNVRGRQPATPTGLAVLNYLPNPATVPTTPAPVSPVWNDTAYSLRKARMYVAREGYELPLPNKATDRTLSLLNTQNTQDGKTKWAINNLTFVSTSTPVLAALKFKINDPNPAAHIIPPDNYDPPNYDIYSVPANPNCSVSSSAYTFALNDVVDVILQNANTLTANNSEVHPWHLHGHDFWILGYGEGVFKDSDYASLNYKNPPRRNSVPLFPYGWSFIRYVADNPGAWPFHCHIESHFHMGMGVIFAEGVRELQLDSIQVPQATLGCGLTKGIISSP